jgi:hypothetical protein
MLRAIVSTQSLQWAPPTFIEFESIGRAVKTNWDPVGDKPKGFFV